MTTQLRTVLMIVLSISWAFVACDDTEETNTAGTEVAAGEVAAGEVTAGEVAAGEVAAGEVAAGEVAAGEIAAGEVAAGEVAAGEVAAGEVTAGEVTAGEVTAGEATAGETSDLIVGEGACTNPDDLARFETLGEVGLSEAIGSCVLSSCLVPDSPGCATCLEGATGFSTECTNCFVAITECTVLNCVGQCAVDSESDECAQCRADNCNADFIACAGVQP